MIVGKYLNTFDDFTNLEKTCKEYRGITEQYHFNPVPLEDEESASFPNSETFHIYGEYDPESSHINTILAGNSKIKKIIIYEDDDKVNDSKYNDIKGNRSVEIRSNKTGRFNFNMDPSITVLVGVDNNILQDEANSRIKRIVIPYHITKIREKCFSGGTIERLAGAEPYQFCMQLKEIFIPNSVSVICPYAFFICGITSINIPSSITFIPEACFKKCNKLESIHLPNTIEYLDNKAFQDCSKLKSIVLPSSVTSLGNKCFKQCSSLSNVIITSNLVSIGNECFNEDNIKHFYSVDQDLISYSVDLPSTITHLGYHAFDQCNKITSVCCDIPEIPFSCFYDCSRLQTVRLSHRVTEINSSAFYSCINLKSISLPSGLKIIGQEAFRDCHQLSAIHIPSSVSDLGVGSFSYCYSLQNVVIHGPIENIPYSAFEECSSLSTINIPSSVTSISFLAFSCCSNLKDITIPSSVVQMAPNTFQSSTQVQVFFRQGSQIHDQFRSTGTYKYPSQRTPHGKFTPLF